MMKKILTLWPKLQLNYLYNLVQKILAKINPVKWLLKPNSKLKLKITPVKKLLVIITLTTCLTVTLNSVRTSVLAYTDQGNINRETTELITQEKSGKNLLEEGKKLYQEGKFSEGIKVLKEAVDSFQKEKEQLGEAIALSNLSLTYQQIGEWESAKNALTGSLEIINQLGGNNPELSKIKGQVLNTKASLEFTQGDAEKALITWEEAGKYYLEGKDEAGYNRTLINRSSALQSIGLYRRALETLEIVKENLKNSNDYQLKSASLRSLGNAYRLVGDLEQSKQVLTESLQQAEKANIKQDIADTMLSLGNTLRAQQDTQSASDYYEKAAKTSPNIATSLKARVNRLSLLTEIEKDVKALEQWKQIEGLLANIPPSRTSIEARINSVQSLLKLKARQAEQEEESADEKQENNKLNLPTSKEIAAILATAVKQAKDIGDLRSQSYSLGQLGAIYEQNKQIGEANKLTQEALLISQSINAAEISYRWQWQLGRLQKAKGEIPEAIASYSQAVETLQSLRNDLVAISSEVQFSFRESVEPIYRQLVGLLLQKDGKGNEPSQENLFKARSVIESLQLAELDNFFQEACLQAKPVQIDKIDRTAALVYPIILEDRLEVVFSVAQHPVIHYSTELPKEQVEDVINKYKQSLTPIGSNKERFKLAKQLYDWLIKPAEEKLASYNIKTLVFVLDGSLRSLPMSTLYDGEKYLVEKYALALSPGLQLLEPRALNTVKLQVLKAGLSESRSGFSALPAVSTELKQIADEVPGTLLLNENLTNANIQSALASAPFPVIHLATHGQFSSKAKDTFILTWDDRINVKQLDQLLKSRTTKENTALELLVLSACQTASGDNRAALGLAGVAVRSGARSTIASLWSVKDEATAALMVNFYKILAKGGVTKAEALRQAQVLLLQQPEFKHPLYWAPFILIGSWL